MTRLNPSTRLHGPAQACLLVVALLVTASATTACTGDRASGPTNTPQATMAEMDGPQAAAWEGRPAYTHTTARTEEAYRYAMQHPLILQWMPCYCGCEAMDHRSNLDCFLRPRMGGTAIQFEEHASYCVICVDTALMAKRMVADGIPLGQIRIAVDAEFGGRAPGTNTELPPT